MMPNLKALEFDYCPIKIHTVFDVSLLLVAVRAQPRKRIAEKCGRTRISNQLSSRPAAESW